MQDTVKISCKKEHVRNKGSVNKFWIVNSTEEVVAKIEKINSRNTAESVSSFDFSTLYTMLEHVSLKEELGWVVRKAFAESGKKYLAVYKEKASFVNETREGTYKVTEETLVQMINFLIDNMVVEFEGSARRQCIGIPMARTAHLP